MANRPPFELGEWYHCFNRGIDKRKVFENDYDANRFLMLLYLANGTRSITLFNAYKPTLEKTFAEDRGNPLVAIGAYCLMPNHYHVLLKEITEGGISIFMRRLGVGYAMYFNAKNERTGNVFLKPFRSRHVADDRYLQNVLQYIHCNPAELFEPEWKAGKVKDMRSLERQLVEYPYSSFASFASRTAANPILSSDAFEVARHPKAARMLADAMAYYAELASDRFER